MRKTKRKLRKTIPLTLALEGKGYSGINLQKYKTSEIKDANGKPIDLMLASF